MHPILDLQRNAVLLTVLALVLLSAAPAQVSAGEKPVADAALKLYVFDCGRIHFDDISAFDIGDDETEIRDLFVPCYLIEHPSGRMLFDAGLPVAAAGQGEVTPEPGMHLHYAVALADQLAALGLTPADIDLVAFSHLHFDHVGSANLFPEATLLIQAAEYQAGFIDRDSTIFEPDLYLGLAEAPRRILSGDHDVFGDGRVQLIAAPGHTPGHQVLLLRLPETGNLVLSGDLYHFRISREQRRVPAFNTDRAASLASMQKVEDLLKREGATLWIEHDQALADTLELAPAYYR